jgi:xylan 1,4-beta-xylosidase
MKALLITMALLAAEKDVLSKPQDLKPGRLELTVDTGKPIGTCHRFWTVNVFTSQHQFLQEHYGFLLKRDKPFMKYANCVRMLGGREDKRNAWYRGVDEKGRVKTDFTDLIRYLKALIDMGYTPRLVLDNVPTAMSTIEQMNKYGNTNPPDDWNLWRQYITALMKTLVDAFGPERVGTWRIRVGTEPDLFPGHWNGTREQYLKHYDITVDAVTRIVPGADIGPGNILNPLGHRKDCWGLDIIDHCAKGTNHVTGKTGTRMRHFSISFYGGVGKPLTLQESLKKARDRLDRYPKYRELTLEVQEFGILHDEHRRRLWGNDITEWGASWYGAVADTVYRNGVAEVYEWSQATAGLPHPRTHVTRMLEMMAGGDRLKVTAKGKATGRAGAIACVKGEKVYVLLYNHHHLRGSRARNTLALTILAQRPAWNMNEWTIDRDHGVWAHQLYRDCAETGLKPLPKSPLYGGQPHRRFGEAWRKLFAKNRAAYAKLAVFPQTANGKPVTSRDGVIALTFDMPDHSVRLIELTPK